MDILNNLEAILSKDAAKIYFVGIGGIGMSAAANMAKDFGYQVLGSDSKEVYSPAKDVLDQNEIEYTIGYHQQHAKDSGADLFVLSAGEDLTNPEAKYIVENNLPRAGLAELLYELAKGSLRVVVTGTHGKTTTTGLLGHILKNLDGSSFVAGGVLQNYQSNFHKGNGHYFVFEGDEYKEQFDDPTPKFHYYKPDILVLTNLEYDHPDQFASMADLEREFAQLIDAMPEDGLIVYNADDANLSKLVHASNIASVSFAVDNDADFKASDVNYGERTTIHVHNKRARDLVQALGLRDEEYQIQLPGRMNVYNALAAIAMLRTLGFSRENIALDLLTYQGIKRRFEILGIKNGITLIDDYAHHPTAVRETLEAARVKYPNAKIWAVFEPHTFSRTKATLDELAKSFGSADEALISEIYPARENAKDATITSADAVNAIAEHQKHVRLVHNKEDAMNIIKTEAKPGDIVIVMAVGSFNRLAYELKETL